MHFGDRVTCRRGTLAPLRGSTRALVPVDWARDPIKEPKSGRVNSKSDRLQPRSVANLGGGGGGFQGTPYSDRRLRSHSERGPGPRRGEAPDEPSFWSHASRAARGCGPGGSALSGDAPAPARDSDSSLSLAASGLHRSEGHNCGLLLYYRLETGS